MARSLAEDLRDPSLFKANRKGEYSYSVIPGSGKAASGVLTLSEASVRDPRAQAAAGGQDRRQTGHEWGSDDGGHLIGARFGGSPYEENLTPQNSNLNRQDYKRMEDSWAAYLDQGEGYKVFVNIESYGENRPSAYMGYAIFEDPDGERHYETYSYTNESRKELEAIDDDLQEYERSEDEVQDMDGKIRKRSSDELWREGVEAIDKNIEARRDDLRDKGWSDESEIEAAVNVERSEMLEELARNIEGDFTQSYQQKEYEETAEELISSEQLEEDPAENQQETAVELMCDDGMNDNQPDREEDNQSEEEHHNNEDSPSYSY